MSELASVDPAALERLSVALERFSGEAERALAGAASAAQRAVDEIGGEVAARRAKLAEVERALEACRAQPDARCGVEETAVGDARRRLDAAVAAHADAQRAVGRFAPAKARGQRETRSITGEGRRLLGVLVRDVDAYLHAVGGAAIGAALGGGSGGASGVGTGRGSEGHGAGGSTGGAAPTTPPGFPDGFALVPLSAIDGSEQDPGNWHLDVSPDDLAWGLDAFFDVVMPAVARGEGADYFQARDDASERRGSRSLSDTYSGFLGTNECIVLDRAGERYTIGNGAHRIWVARQLGLDAIPARIS